MTEDPSPSDFLLSGLQMTPDICSELNAVLKPYRLSGAASKRTSAFLSAVHQMSLLHDERKAGRGSGVTGTGDALEPEPSRELREKAWLSPAEAGRLLEPPMSDRGVRKAAEQERLRATRGEDNAWQIIPTDLEQFGSNAGRRIRHH